MCVLSFDVVNGCSSVKKLISEGMSNIYYWWKLTFKSRIRASNGIYQMYNYNYLMSNITYSVLFHHAMIMQKTCKAA